MCMEMIINLDDTGVAKEVLMLMPALCTIIIVSPVAKENSEEGSVLAEIKSSGGNYPAPF